MKQTKQIEQMKNQLSAEKAGRKGNNLRNNLGNARSRLVLLVCILMVIMSFMTGCGGGDDKGSGDGKGESKDDGIKIGIAQIVEHPSLNTIRENIIAQLAEEGYIDGVNGVVIDYQDGQNEQSNLKTICQKFTSNNYDLIIAIATPTAQVAYGETTEIPIIFSAVTDPVAAGLVAELDTAPGGNITGVSDAVSASKIMDMAMLITPDIKNLGVLYTSSETNSQSVVEDLREYASANGLTLIESPVTNSNEIPQAAANLAAKADAVFSPIDNTVASSMPMVVKTFNDAKIPFYVGADSMVNDGGLATDGVNYEELGKETGKMAARVLGGENPGDIPVMTMDETKFYINRTTAETIEVDFPMEILMDAEVLGE